MQGLSRLLVASSLAAVSLGAVLPAGAQVTPGQRDDFEDGTTQGWLVGLLGAPHPAPPVNVPTGGPAGANDSYLRLTAVGGAEGPGSKLSVLNFQSQWAGNYVAAGVNGISFDAINLGQTDLFLRILLENPTMGPPTDLAATSAITLRAGGGWQSLVFPLYGPTGLVALEGSVTNVLATATTMRIYHSPQFAPNGPGVVAVLGVDNVTAMSTPEPSTFVLLASGLAVGLVMRRRRARG